MDETPLPSRTNQGVVRIDDTIRRKTSPWSQAVHELLKYLSDKEFKYSPQFLGIDNNGREILSYFEGVSGKEGWAKVVPEDGLRAFAKLLRAYHDVVAEFRPKNHQWATATRALSQDEIICHGDFGPWNIVWQGSNPVGIVDWDLARPAKPIYDVAYAIEYSAPFRSDEECMKWLRYEAPPNRKRRLKIFADAYGLNSTDGMVDEVISTQKTGIEQVKLLAQKGHDPQVQWIKDGHLKELESRVSWSENNRHLFEHIKHRQCGGP